MFSIFRFYMTFMMVNLSLNDFCDHETGQSCTKSNENTNNWAIVPFVNHFPIQQFSQKINEIFIGNEKIVLHQSWQTIGVAGVVWDCSRTLAEYFHNNSQLIKNKTLLELGAGTGLASIVSAKLGAKVTSTDIPKVLELLNRNVNENLFPLENYHVKVEPLIWGSSVDQKIIQLPDVIIGADLIYDETLFDDLISTLILYSSISTEIYIAARNRYERDEKFFEKLKNYFTVEEIFYDHIRDIRLFLCHKLTK